MQQSFGVTCCSSCTSVALHKSQGRYCESKVTVSSCSMWARSLCHASNNIKREIKKYVSEKDAWRMRDHGPLGWEGTIDDKWSICCCALWMHIRIMCPIIRVALPEVHNKMTKIDWLTLKQPFFEHEGLCQAIHSR